MRKESNPHPGPRRAGVQRKIGCQVRRGNSATPRAQGEERSTYTWEACKRAVVLAEAHGRRSPNGRGRACGAGPSCQFQKDPSKQECHLLWVPHTYSSGIPRPPLRSLRLHDSNSGFLL